MILGIGTDIIDIRRIEKTILKYGDKFKNKCFLKSEIQKSENRINSTPSYAKIYAANPEAGFMILLADDVQPLVPIGQDRDINMPEAP